MSAWDNIRKLLQSGAPLLATALGGPLAGVATKLIGGALLGKNDASADELAAAIQSPDAMVKLKQLEVEWQEKLKQADIDLFAFEVQDRASARDREVKMATIGSHEWIMKAIAIIIVLGFLGMLTAMFLFVIPPSMNEAAMLLIGALASQFGSIVNYYFGSSAGSRRKDELNVGMPHK